MLMMIKRHGTHTNTPEYLGPSARRVSSSRKAAKAIKAAVTPSVAMTAACLKAFVADMSSQRMAFGSVGSFTYRTRPLKTALGGMLCVLFCHMSILLADKADKAERIPSSVSNVTKTLEAP